jgi:hypothetical protein
MRWRLPKLHARQSAFPLLPLGLAVIPLLILLLIDFDRSSCKPVSCAGYTDTNPVLTRSACATTIPRSASAHPGKLDMQICLAKLHRTKNIISEFAVLTCSGHWRSSWPLSSCSSGYFCV